MTKKTESDGIRGYDACEVVRRKGVWAMGIFTPDINNLRELYRIKLQQALNSEKQIVDEGLPAMIKASTSPEVAEAFRSHLQESRNHVTRLERILDEIEGEENQTKCKVTAALIGEASSVISDTKDSTTRDVVLLASGNAVEHHEIAIYGTLKTWAEVLGEFEQAQVLERTLEEEKNADDLLTKLSSQINVEAPVA